MSAIAPRTRECLCAIVASAGNHFQPTEGLKPLAATPIVQGAPAVEGAEPAMFSYLGDVMVRFVFTAKDCLESPVRQEDMVRLDLTPERALALATLNFKRMHGAPQAGLFVENVYTLRGGNPDVYAGYLLDRAYWRSQLERCAQGVIVAVPKRGSLFFAYAADPAAIQALKRLAARLYHAADEHGLSACLYRFDAQGWHVHERLPLPQLAQASSSALRLKDVLLRDTAGDARRRAERDAEKDDGDQEEKLALAASGQKMVIYSILLNFVLRGVERGTLLLEWMLIVLSIVVGIYAMVGVVKLCSGLEKTQGQKILFMALSFLPFANLLALVYLSHTASKALRAAGWTVGLLGARP